MRPRPNRRPPRLRRRRPASSYQNPRVVWGGLCASEETCHGLVAKNVDGARPPPDVTRRNLKSDPSPAPAARASCLIVHRGLRLPSRMRTTGSGVDHVPLTPISGATSVPPSDSADGYSLGAGGSSPFSCASALCSSHRRRNSRSVAGSRCCNVGKRKRERGSERQFFQIFWEGAVGGHLQHPARQGVGHGTEDPSPIGQRSRTATVLYLHAGTSSRMRNGALPLRLAQTVTTTLPWRSEATNSLSAPPHRRPADWVPWVPAAQPRHRGRCPALGSSGRPWLWLALRPGAGAASYEARVPSRRHPRFHRVQPPRDGHSASSCPPFPA